MVAKNAMIMMGITLVLLLILPIITALAFKRKFKIKLVPIITGAGLFIVFAMGLEQVLHGIVLQPTTDGTIALKENSPILYVLYGAFAAGIFEETARFIGFKFLKKKYQGVGTAIAYGIGHGGAEVWLLGALTMLNNLIISMSINANIPAVMKVLPKAAVTALTNTSSMTYLVTLVERIPALAVQICLSILVWLAINQAGKKWFYPLAILLHAIVDIPAALYQMGIFTNLILLYVILYAEAILLIFFVISLFKHHKQAAKVV